MSAGVDAIAIRDQCRLDRYVETEWTASVNAGQGSRLWAVAPSLRATCYTWNRDASGLTPTKQPPPGKRLRPNSAACWCHAPDALTSRCNPR